MLHRLLDEVVRINSIAGYDAFYEFAGHVKWVEITIHKDADYGEDGKPNIFMKLEAQD